MSKQYLIYSPPLTHLSAGVKSLHLLRDKLEAAGHKATMVPMGLAAQAVSDDFIVVYPEIVMGNPLKAKHVVRYLLYYAGVYRSNETKYPATDIIWAYSTRIAKSYGTNNVLLLPVSDPGVFHPPLFGQTDRKGACFYAHKYKNFYRGELLKITKDAFEITNPGLPQREIADLLRRSEVLFVYEDTALMFEAVMCGCPVVCLPTIHFKESHILDDFHTGIAWGTQDLAKAKESVKDGYSDYLELEMLFNKNLKRFIIETQNH